MDCKSISSSKLETLLALLGLVSKLVPLVKASIISRMRWHDEDISLISSSRPLSRDKLWSRIGFAKNKQGRMQPQFSILNVQGGTPNPSSVRERKVNMLEERRHLQYVHFVLLQCRLS